MKVTCEISPYEIDGKEVIGLNKGDHIGINSHWCRDEMVVITINDKSMTVKANELIKAIHNATNWK